MPYPVPPPSPPPVVEIQSPGDSNQPSSLSTSSVSPPESAPAPIFAAASGTPSPCEPALSSCESSPLSPPDGVLPGAALAASPLGSPMEVNLSTLRATDVAGSSANDEGFGTKAADRLPELATLPSWQGSDRIDVNGLAQSGDLAVLKAALERRSHPGAPDGVAQTTPDPSRPAIDPVTPSPSSAVDAAPDAAPGSNESTAQPPVPGAEGTENPTSPPADGSGSVLTIPGQGEATPAPDRPAEAPAQPSPGAPAQSGPPSGFPTPSTQPNPAPPAVLNGVTPEDTIELTADRQDYDERQQVFTAEGNAVLRFRRAVLKADRIQVNIPNRLAVAEGNVALTRGQQVLEGNYFRYNFVQNAGTILGGRGSVFVPAAQRDFNSVLPTDVSAGAVGYQILSDRLQTNQPFQVVGSTGGISASVSGGLPDENSNQIVPRNLSGNLSGNVNRLRFQAEQLDFTPEGWTASNVRLTNDPFSPPELEVRSPYVTFSRQSETRSVLRARNPRLVFDQGFSLPLLVNQFVFDQRQRNPGFISFGFDERDRGGFYFERTFNVLAGPIVNLALTPQFLIQRAITDGDFGASAFGLVANLGVRLTPTTSLQGIASFSSLDPTELDKNLRASLRLRQQVLRHTITAEYSYRDRLFNGSLGFQTVHSSYGFVITSPRYTLGTTGINVSYQAGIQRINANTDQQELLPPPPRDNNRVSLTRYQVAGALSRSFYLWVGRPLPPTADQGLRYSPTPIVPYISLNTGLKGVYSAYGNSDEGSLSSNNNHQASLTGTLGISAQFGHFSRPFLDYTALSATVSATALNGESPFTFDRVADRLVVTAGITQQIYGPIRAGVQVIYNPDKDKNIATIYTLQYNRRTYAVSLSFSPELETASLNLRVSDFNWVGSPGPFSSVGIDPVVNGVEGIVP